MATLKSGPADRPVHNNLDFRLEKKGINHPDPIDPQDVATKAYVDAHGGGSTNKYTETIGDGVATQFDVVHGLGTTTTIVSLTRVSDGGLVYCDVLALDANTTRLDFTNPPSVNQYTCTVVG